MISKYLPPHPHGNAVLLLLESLSFSKAPTHRTVPSSLSPLPGLLPPVSVSPTQPLSQEIAPFLARQGLVGLSVPFFRVSCNQSVLPKVSQGCTLWGGG